MSLLALLLYLLLACRYCSGSVNRIGNAMTVYDDDYYERIDEILTFIEAYDDDDDEEEADPESSVNPLVAIP